VELAFWNSIGSSSDPRLYREYLAKYPNGKFATLAKLKLQEAPAKATETPNPPAPAPAAAAPGTPPLPQSNLPPLRQPVKPEDYAGPLRGTLVWAGSLDPDTTLTIQAGKTASGFLQGDLPRVPVTLQILAVGATFVEQPSAANQFDRIVLRNVSSSAVRGIVIHWRVAK
jgi:hypothetical protein